MSTKGPLHQLRVVDLAANQVQDGSLKLPPIGPLWAGELFAPRPADKLFEVMVAVECVHHVNPGLPVEHQAFECHLDATLAGSATRVNDHKEWIEQAFSVQVKTYRFLSTWNQA